LSVPRVSSDEEGEAILLFKLEEECLAFRASAFQSVAEPAPIHGVPHKSDALFLGLSNTAESCDSASP
jgi:chemotaxis signal transduction protein